MKHCIALLLLALAVPAHATEFHVSVRGSNQNDGTAAKPFKTISAAACAAQPGDIITVHAGLYRERITPPRGGESDDKRIVYQAAPGEKVEIRGSEVVTKWEKVQGNTWKATLPNSFFGDFNPYSDLIRGDWFNSKKREHHTGAVYLNGDWLIEAAKLDDVLKPAGKEALWYGKVEKDTTTIWAQFPGVDPNAQLVEINVRPTVFTPDKPGINYITVRGFIMRHAATNWAPPTAGQIGLITAYWCKGWIIENNTISHSVCSGIALGKHGDKYDNTSANSAQGYVKTIERAHAFAIPWTRDAIGHHIVRNNHISHCEQTGIVGSMGCAFSTVTGNTIHDIHVRQLFTGAEMAGIKFHAAIDTEISYNHIYRTCRGLWLDWMAQGTRVSQNLFYDNGSQDLFLEVDHGPCLVDNNIFLSTTCLLDMSEGTAFAHNLFAGKISSNEEPGRQTPYHPAHDTKMAGLATIKGGDDRFYNNIFVGTGANVAPASKKTNRHHSAAGYGLWVYDNRQYPLQTGGNVYLGTAKPYKNELQPLVLGQSDPQVKLALDGERATLQLNFDEAIPKAKTQLVTTELLGKAKIPNVAYENPDGTPLKIDTDFFGKPRSADNPTPGPFENPGTGTLTVKVK